MNDLAHKMAKEWLENNLADYLSVIPYGKHAVEALANQMKFYLIEMTGGFSTNRKNEMNKRDIAVKRAIEWLGNHFPVEMNGVNADWFISNLATELEAYAIDIDGDGDGTMTSKTDVRIADIKFRRNQIAKERDKLREILTELEGDLESFDVGIEQLGDGIDSIERGLDSISEVV